MVNATDSASEVPLYHRKTTEIPLRKDANTYCMDFGKAGFFYYVMEEIMDKEPQEDRTDYSEQGFCYRFYYQSYDGKEAVPFCEISEGYVRGFSHIERENQVQLSVLITGEEAHILEYDASGKLLREIKTDDRFVPIEERPKLLALPDGSYAASMGGNIYLINREGQVEKEIPLQKQVDDLLLSEAGQVYAIVWKDDTGNAAKQLIYLDLQGGKAGYTEELPSKVINQFAYGDGLALVYADRVDCYDVSAKQIRTILDLDRQSILAGQIQAMQGDGEELRLVPLDPVDGGALAYLVTLTRKEETEAGRDDKKEAELYTPDGRRILHVAVPEDYEKSVEFYAKKYNQTSDQYFVQTDRFAGSLEDFLGKGNRPDVVMFQDHTRINDYVQKQILEDLAPMFEKQQEYSLDGVVPKVREVLGADRPEGMYAMAGRFQLLLRASTGEEYGEGDHCDTVSYLRWLDRYLTEKEVEGTEGLEYYLYATVPNFYEEETAQAYFDSEPFKHLMETYREVSGQHSGEFKTNKVYKTKGPTVRSIAGGPKWKEDYRDGMFIDPAGELKGLPGIRGEELIYIRLDHPMGILSTSECKEAAFDFIMYFCSINHLVDTGYESEYGIFGNTPAQLSVFEKVLNELIFETDMGIFASPELVADGVLNFDKLVMVYYTQEHLEQLRYLIENAQPSTKTQEDIYGMLMEEMDGYFQGGKDLDACCEILQSRVKLYLAEGQ